MKQQILKITLEMDSLPSASINKLREWSQALRNLVQIKVAIKPFDISQALLGNPIVIRTEDSWKPCQFVSGPDKHGNLSVMVDGGFMIVSPSKLRMYEERE